MSKDIMDWTLSQVWNAGTQKDFGLQPRDYLWASELGKPYIDLWYKLKATPYTNPPDSRAKRKFESGNIWEWIIELILKRSRLIIEQRTRCEWQYNGLMKVTGKADFIAGGSPGWEQARNEVGNIGLPDFLEERAVQVIDYLENEYPNGMGVKPLEIKSVSAFMFEALENKSRALKIHRLQLFHYLKSLDMPRGDIIYVCRDDNRMMQIPIYLEDGATEHEYKTWIEGMTNAFRGETPPEPEKCIVFDDDMGKFTKNNQVAWSGYLTMIYGIENQAEFDNMYMSKASNWNRVVSRVKTANARKQWLCDHNSDEGDIQKEKVEGKKTATIQYICTETGEQIYLPVELTKGYAMTAKNLEALEEIQQAGFDIDYVTRNISDIEEQEEVYD